MRTFVNPIVKNKINFMNLLVATYHGQIRPSDTDNNVSLICYIISFKNHIAIYDKTRSY